LLRSRVQGDVLAWTFLHPEREYSLTDLASRVGASVRSVHHEVDRLVSAGVLRDRRAGNLRLVRASQDTVLAGPLTDLLAVTFGPLPVMADLLAGVPGVATAYLYGSWAARYRGRRVILHRTSTSWSSGRPTLTPWTTWPELPRSAWVDPCR
jgi:DNA-binding transcriptional ArsR family regulator